MFERVYNFRFELFFLSQIVVLFGGLFIPETFFQERIAPISFLLNLTAGTIMIARRKELFWFFLVLLVTSSIIFAYVQANDEMTTSINYIQFGIYFFFYFIVTFEIIRQVWQAEKVNRNVILGLISGFICLGLVGFFICMGIELVSPDSFSGNLLETQHLSPNHLTEQLMYFSFITLMTIGYGDITPITPLAQKATILIGLFGQFYLVIVTAVVVGKLINQKHE